MKRASTVVAALQLLGGCGGGGGGPTAPSTPSAGGPVPAGTVLTVVSGETSQPVGAARMVVAGRAYATDGAGQVPLAEPVDPGSLLDVTSPPFLDRQSLLRSSSATRFTLWPRTSPTGLDENYTATLVYTDVGGAEAAVGSSPMVRLPPSTTQVLIVPSPQIQADAAAMGFHQDAVAALTGASGGRIAYALAAQAPGGGAAAFETRIDPADPLCKDRVRAFTSYSTRNDEIVSARIVFCTSEAAESVTVIHEMGHTFGLQHSPDPSELMYGTFVRGRASAFSARELLAMNLMLQRRGGNRFPDNDRQAVSGTVRTRTIACP